MTKIKSLALVNLVIPKTEAKHKLSFNKPTSRIKGRFVEHLSAVKKAIQSVTKILCLALVNLVALEATA